MTRWFLRGLQFLLLVPAWVVPVAFAETHPANKEEARGLIAEQKSAMPESGNEMGSYWLLAIGINEYRHWKPLRNAVSDASELVRLLSERYTFDAGKTIFLRDRQATAKGIIAAFVDLKKRMAGNDSLLVYFAGHGHLDEFGIGSWVPVDAARDDISGNITSDRVTRIVAQLPARHVFIVADACFSGDLLISRGESPLVQGDRYFVESNRRASRQALSSGGIEMVADGGANGHSVFAHHLLRELELNNQPYLTASLLSARVERLVSMNSQQAPRWSRLAQTGDEYGEFFFVERQSASRHDVSEPATLPLNNETTKDQSGDVTATATADVGLLTKRFEAEMAALDGARSLAYARLAEMRGDRSRAEESGVSDPARGNSDFRSGGKVGGYRVIDERVTWIDGVPRATVTLRAHSGEVNR